MMGCNRPSTLGAQRERSERGSLPQAGCSLRGHDDVGVLDDELGRKNPPRPARFSTHQLREGERVTDTGNGDGDIAARIWR